MKRISLFLLSVLCLCVSMANAQGIYKDIIWVPVTYYDFHSDKSNPEFEVTPADGGSLHSNMVAQGLDAEGKPSIGTTTFVNQYIKYWFRPWAGNPGSSIHAKGDSTIPVYNNNVYVNTLPVNTDTAFINKVIHDSLPFRHLGNGIYQYDNQAFFPLDGRGFGNESSDGNVLHNYSFTMELKWPFQKRVGQTFDFMGDDDVWAFVNGRLAMDVGGIHGPLPGSFSMDSPLFSGINANAVCTLSVFYAERHVTGSDIRITTNMISPKLSVQITANEICLGDTVIAKAQMKSGDQVLTQFPAGVTLTWHLIDPFNDSATTFKPIDITSRRFVPTKPSLAKIWGDLYDQINNVHLYDTVTINVKYCDPDSINLYDSIGDPKTMIPLPDTITVVAGTPKNVYAKLFDMYKNWLYLYEQVDSLSNRIKWTVSDTNAKISSTQGHVATFTSTVAWKDYKLTASYYWNGSKTLSHSVVIKVIPGPPATLTIEPNPDGATISPNHPQPFPNNTISIQSNETVIKGYAALRDQYGNNCYPSNPTNWSIDKPIASLAKGNETIGEIIITRIDSGLTVVHATDTKTNISGFANLSIVNYYYKELKIAVKQTGTNILVPIDTLMMNTNQDTVFYVIGLRSDNNQWEPTATGANWEISKPLLGGNMNNASAITSYPVSPNKPDTGWVRVTKGNDGVTKPDTVVVMFTPGPPIRSEIELITLPNQRIAGDTIVAVVRIYNKDGLVPGPYCIQKAAYQDTLGNGGKPYPIVIEDSGIDTINQLPSTAHSIAECFNGGLDTIKIVLYNAPVDNVHKLFVHLDNLPVAYTEPFHLYPGKIDRLDIQYADGTSVGDTVTLKAPDESMMFYAVGFDRFGNRIPGLALSNWSVSGNLPAVNGQNVGQIYFETKSVISNVSGDLTAASSDPNAPLYVKDHVFIKIIGPAINLTRAVTRDVNGNGYLDHIELHFAQPVSLPANFIFSGMSISYGTIKFTVAGIENNTGRTDSVWSIAINEEQKGIPQTSWKPKISFDRNETFSIAGAVNAECQDGAGPVVWYVENKLGKAEDHTEDVVTVTLSEPVLRSNGSSLASSDTPSVVFYVWEKNPHDTTQFIMVDKILVGINAFTGVQTTSKDPKQSVVSFKMSNKNDLSSNYYMNINTGTMYISDNAQPPNLPNLNNQKKRVIVVNGVIHPISFPNPAIADASRVNPGDLFAKHDPTARDDLKRGLHSGSITSVKVFIPPAGSGVYARCFLKIYDAVGNLVIQAKNDNLFDGLATNVNMFDVDFYWNGFTAQKSKAAPGVYMEVIYIEYWGSSAAKLYNDQVRKGKYPLVSMVGIGK